MYWVTVSGFTLYSMFDVCVVEVTSQAIVQRPHVSFISGANSFLIVVSQSCVG